MRLLAVVFGYEVVWFACVASPVAWWGPAAACAYLVFLATHPRRPGNRWFLLPIFGLAFGTLVDGMLASVGGMRFAQEPILLQLPPWMPMLWAAFAGSIPYFLHYFRDRLAWVAVFGAIGGPLAYFGAARLGAVTDIAPWAWWVVALEWAAFPPLVLKWIFPERGSRLVPA